MLHNPFNENSAILVLILPVSILHVVLRIQLCGDVDFVTAVARWSMHWIGNTVGAGSSPSRGRTGSISTLTQLQLYSTGWCNADGWVS